MISWIPIDHDHDNVPFDRKLLYLFKTEINGAEPLYKIEYCYYSKITIVGRTHITHWAECNLPE